MHCVLKDLKQNFAVHLDGKKLTCLTRNLVQILMNLVFLMAKTKVIRKNANWRRSEAKRYKNDFILFQIYECNLNHWKKSSFLFEVSF